MVEGSSAEQPQRNPATRVDVREEMQAVTDTIWRLRQPDGCPWDRVQTHESIAKNMIEEAYEAVDCIEDADAAHLREELGDVLMQVVLHAQIAADAGEFTMADVAADINAKLIRRHPHVFGAAAKADVGAPAVVGGVVAIDAASNDATAPEPASGGSVPGVSDSTAPAPSASTPRADTAEDVLAIWDSVKLAEKEARDAAAAEGNERPAGLLDGVPCSLPALMQAQKVSRKAAAVGFEWDTVADVWDKVAEERAEFEAEAAGTDARELEFGDILFALVNVARKEGIDAESALRTSTAKFRARWKAMEDEAFARGTALESLSTAELNDLWDAVKREWA